MYAAWGCTMAEMTVKPVKLWVLTGADRKGMLAEALEPLAAAGANLRIVMAYRMEQGGRAAVEVFPIEGKAVDAARKAGFKESETACLLAEGDDKPGQGAQMARAIANAGVSMAFLMEETVGKRYSAAIGFSNEADATTARKAIEGLGGKKK